MKNQDSARAGRRESDRGDRSSVAPPRLLQRRWIVGVVGGKVGEKTGVGEKVRGGAGEREGGGCNSRCRVAMRESETLNKTGAKGW